MRQLSPPTNLLLACLAALGLAGTLGFPWYASAPAAEPGATEGGLEELAAGIRRWFEGNGMTGSETLGTPETALLGLAAATMLLAVLFALPLLRPMVRDLFRLVPLFAPAIVALLLINPPGDNAALETRWGAFVALGAALLMANSAWHGSQMSERKAAPAAYVPPPRPGY